ncbi:MAG: FHA domain-containing protein [Sandaracinaceae bacterium]|nr:FHA domain-containing protein [Sandaracinaceae bacterium]
MSSNPSDRSSRPSYPNENSNTIMPGRFALPEIGRVQEALELAWRTVQAAPKPGVPGVHVFGVWGKDVLVRFLAASPDELLVLGRHEECDIILKADPTVSLRHLLARTIRLADGSIALRLLDLMTPRPFLLHDGTMQRSVVATGPFAVAVGQYVIGGIPSDVHQYETRGGPYRAPALVDRAERIPRAALNTPVGLRRSRITLLPGSRFVTQVPAWPQDGFARVTLSRGGHVSSIVLDEATLEQGLLIGRAERCLDRGFRTVLTTSISRVHLMLLRDNDQDVAIDLGSTQGTYASQARLRMVRLPPARCHLKLGYVDPVDLVWDRVNV